MISIAQFRADFPEFGSTATFSNSVVQFWLNTAYVFLNASRWGSQLDIGAELYAAHHIILEARGRKESNNGGLPGQNTGPLNSKSVDKVSMGYDTGSASIEGGGHWNLTIYGTRFLYYSSMFGAGPLQIGTATNPNTDAWAGPLMTPGFTNFS